MMNTVIRSAGALRPKKISSCDGFTLIEILVALALFGIAVAVLSQLFSASLRNIARSESYVPALIIAESKMSEIMSADHLIEQEQSVNLDNGRRVDVAIRPILEKRTQNLPVRLMEIDVTVSWPTAKGRQSITLQSQKAVKTSLQEEEIDLQESSGSEP